MSFYIDIMSSRCKEMCYAVDVCVPYLIVDNDFPSLVYLKLLQPGK